MRGGAIPIVAWGTLLVALLVINAIWTGDGIQVAMFGFAALVIFGFAAAFAVLAGRAALRRGAPEPVLRPEPAPQVSVGAAVAGLSLACILFGFVFGSFLIYFGAGMLVLSLGRLAIELRSERETLRRERDR